MALFGVKKSKVYQAPLPALPAPDFDDASIRMINDEYTPRVNVPAIALGLRRANLSLPAAPAALPEPPAAQRRLVVGAGISLAGEISECDALIVNGVLEAQVQRAARLEISAQGIFRGTATADTADIAGRFEGELNVTRLRLRGSAQLSGRVNFTKLEIEPGAQIAGELSCTAPASTQNQPQNTVITFPSYPTAQRA